jgi:hypothetical protein
MSQHAFRTITDTRSHTRPALTFRTNPDVPFAKFMAQQKRLSEQLEHLKSAVGRFSEPRKNRTPARRAADEETRANFDTASEAVNGILHRLITTFPNERAWSKADKADMLSSVDPFANPIREGFVKTFQASLTDRLVELHKAVKDLVTTPTLDRTEDVVVRRL